jgi:hypothetical protein
MFEHERLKDMKPLIKKTDTSAKEMYDGRVADYNSRCGRYKFQRGLDTAIRREIADNREYLLREAKSIVEASR